MIPSIHGLKKVPIWCPLGFCPLVSFCEENNALRFQVIHIVQSWTSQFSNPSDNSCSFVLLVRILISYSLCLLAELHPFCILLQVTSRHLRQSCRSFNWNVYILFDLHPLQSLLFINWMVVSLLHLCNRSPTEWPTTLEDSSILQQPFSFLPSGLGDPSRSSSLQKDLLPLMNLRSKFKRKEFEYLGQHFNDQHEIHWVVEVLVGCSSKVCRQLSCSLFYSSFSDICAMCPLLFFQVFFSFFFRSEWQSLLIEELFGLEHTLQCLLASRKVRRALLPNSAITAKNLQSSR